MKRIPLILGVDGGGTKSLGLVSDLKGRVLARREVGASNPNVVGEGCAVRNLCDLVRQCCSDIETTPAGFAVIVLGLAGAGSREVKEKLRAGISETLFQKKESAVPIVIETDARVGIEGAFGGGPGILAVAGTGSVVIGKRPDGSIATVGGWGRMLGDEGSGYAIGREALRSLAWSIDGRSSPGLLNEMLSARFDLHSRDQIIAAVYRNGFDFASVAPLVLDASSQGDEVAQRILKDGAVQLTEQIQIMTSHIGGLHKIGVVLTGGLLENGTVYADILHMQLLASLPNVDVRPPQHSAAHGALLLALKYLEGQ